MRIIFNVVKRVYGNNRNIRYVEAIECGHLTFLSLTAFSLEVNADLATLY
jgi:hypothetical protein